MAVPTITSITPSTGSPTGDQMIEVIGTNFRLPTTPDPTLIPVPVAPDSVRVTFGGTEAVVHVISDTRLFVKVPARNMPISTDGKTTLGSEAVDVVIENIDDNGVLIPTETVTSTDGYTYKRPGVSHVESSPYLTITTTMVDLLRSQVLNNTVLDTSVDYDFNETTPEIEVEETPQLVLTGPSTVENTFYTQRKLSGIESSISDEWFQYRRPRFVDLVFEVMGVTNSTVELINLMNLFETVIDRNVVVEWSYDPDDLTLKTPIELHLTRNAQVQRVLRYAKSDLRVFTAEITLKGYPQLTLPGVENDGIIGVSATVTQEPTLELVDQIGEDNPAAQGAATNSPPDAQ